MYSLQDYKLPSPGWYICYIDEPTLTHHYHPKSIVYIRLHSQCCIFYGFGPLHNDMYPTLQCHTEYFHYPKHPLYSIYSSLHPISTSCHQRFPVFIVLPFPTCHIIGIIGYAAFSDWLLSLSNMHLSFLHVFSWLDSSFLFSSE